MLGRFALGFVAGGAGFIADDIKTKRMGTEKRRLALAKFDREDQARREAAALSRSQDLTDQDTARDDAASLFGRQVEDLNTRIATAPEGSDLRGSLVDRLNVLRGRGKKTVGVDENDNQILINNDGTSQLVTRADGATPVKRAGPQRPAQAKLQGFVHPTKMGENGKPLEGFEFASDRDAIQKRKDDGFLPLRTGQTINIGERAYDKKLAEKQFELKEQKVRVQQLLAGIDDTARLIGEGGGADVLGISSKLVRTLSTIQYQGASIFSRAGINTDALKRLDASFASAVPEGVAPDSEIAARIRSNLVSISIALAKSAEGDVRLSDPDVDRQLKALGVSGDPVQMIGAFEQVARGQVRDLGLSYKEFLRDETLEINIPDFRRHFRNGDPGAAPPLEPAAARAAGAGGSGATGVSQIDPNNPDRFGPQTGFGSFTGRRNVPGGRKPPEQMTPEELEAEINAFNTRQR